MKKVISSFTVIVLILLVFQSSAQVKFGVKAGLNLANMTAKDNDQIYSKDYKSKAGYHFGVTAEFAVNEKFSIEPALLFSTKGFKLEDTYSGHSYKVTANLNYLEIPINALYKMDLGGTKLFVSAGPYLGYALSGKAKTTSSGSPDEETTIKIGSGTDKDIKAIDFGLNIGAGVEFGAITLGLQYGLGLANLTNSTTASEKETNKVFGISVGYKFASK
jgi:hypothetical protein